MKQENVTHNEKINQSIETDPEVTKIIELVYKDIKSVIINISHTSKKLKKQKVKHSRPYPCIYYLLDLSNRNHKVIL